MANVHETDAAAEALAGLEPEAFWQRFATLTTIPRPSRHEERAGEHVREWAAGHGYEIVGDEIGNLVVRVPATPGREDAPTVVLQGHLDMVCERSSTASSIRPKDGSGSCARATG